MLGHCRVQGRSPRERSTLQFALGKELFRNGHPLPYSVVSVAVSFLFFSVSALIPENPIPTIDTSLRFQPFAWSLEVRYR